jgi:hypothetical protein
MHELEIYCQETVSELLDNSLETTDEIYRLHQLSQHSWDNEADFYEASMQSLWLEASDAYFQREPYLG